MVDNISCTLDTGAVTSDLGWNVSPREFADITTQSTGPRLLVSERCAHGPQALQLSPSLDRAL